MNKTDQVKEFSQPAEKPEQEKSEFVTVKDFTEFQNNITNLIKNLSDVVTSSPKPTPAIVEGGPDDQTPIPPSWKKAVTEILGPEFECEIIQPDSGGTLFKILVPRALSNAPSIHWEQHTRDVRSKEIGNTGLPGVKEWCLKVRKNLEASGIKMIQYP